MDDRFVKSFLIPKVELQVIIKALQVYRDILINQRDQTIPIKAEIANIDSLLKDMKEKLKNY